MRQKASDQNWQQLQTHLEGFVCQAFRNDGQRIEYKPRFMGQLLEPPSEQDRISISEDFSQKGGGT